MREVKLDTGVIVTFNDKDEIESLYNPYWDKPKLEFELTDSQMLKLKIGFFVILWVFNLVFALTLLNN